MVNRRAFFQATVIGVEGHSGNDFLKGRNAIVEMYALIEKLRNCKNLSNRSTICFESIHGGELVSSVPGKCQMVFSISVDAGTPEYMLQQIKELSEHTYIEGTILDVCLIERIAECNKL